MDDIIKAELAKQEVSTFHTSILSSTKDLVEMSRGFMSRFYDDWDASAMTYRGERWADQEDVKAAKEAEPQKMVVPLTFAQVQTFISFAFLLLTQNQKFFELQPTGDEDYKIRDDVEKFLDRDLRRNKWSVVLYQFLLDAARFNLSVVKSRWEETYQMVPVEETIPPLKFAGIPLRKGKLLTTMQKILKFQGNELLSVSPYRWFPDTRLPFERFQKGEFCASEEEISITELKKLEQLGEVSGTKWLKDMSTDQPRMRTLWGDDSRGDRLNRFNNVQFSKTTDGGGVMSSGSCVRTECQRWIVPSEYKIDGDNALGPEDYPILYVIQYVNDQRVIKCEPMNYLHGEFTYDIGQFSPDIHRSLGPSLAGIMDQLSAVVSWFINSHVVSVRKVIKDKLIVDPSAIDTKTLDSKSPYIYLKKSFASTGVDKWVKQLEVRDVTAGHMGDADTSAKMVQMVTGVNDNAMGQYNSGRRSATEARAVTSGAASRLKTIMAVMWSMGFSPLGQKMLSNLRQGITEETWTRVIGKPDMTDPMKIVDFQERYLLFKASPEEIVGGDDFFLFDSTLPSEKGFIAQSLQELIQVALANPESAQALGITNIPDLMRETLDLRGVPNLSRFFTPQQKDQAAAIQRYQQFMAAQQAASGGAPTGQPNLQLLQGGAGA